MPDKPEPPASSSSPGKGGSGLKKPVMGLPAWMWGVGAVVLVGGYLYLRHSSSSSASSSQQKPTGGQPVAVVGGGSPTGLSMEQLLLMFEDLQGSKSKGHGHGRHGGGHHHKPPPHHVNPGGPERTWLEHKTGSKHPWTWLSKHNERVQVGPHGSRTIVKKRGGK